MTANNALYINDDIVKFSLDGSDYSLPREQFDMLIMLYNKITSSLGGRAAYVDEKGNIHVLYFKEETV